MSRHFNKLIPIIWCLCALGCRPDAPTKATQKDDDPVASQIAEDDISSTMGKNDAAKRGPQALKHDEDASTNAATTTERTDEPKPQDVDETPNPHQPAEAVQENESARQFQFDGSDQELELILGQRPTPPFYIDDLLTIEDLRSSLGPHTPTQIGHLEGQEVSAFYNHRWFQSAKDERLGVVFQYWHFRTSTAASTHYDLMEKTAISKPQPVGAASQAFYTVENGTTSLVALSLGLPAVIALTCDVEMCHVPQLMRWVKLIESRARP